MPAASSVGLAPPPPCACVHAQAVPPRAKVALGADHLAHQRAQAVARVGRALVEVGRVVLEHTDRRRVVQWRIGHQRLQHVRRHAGVVLVDEAPVGPHEAAFARAAARAA
jgi:hypothetical protein